MTRPSFTVPNSRARQLSGIILIGLIALVTGAGGMYWFARQFPHAVTAKDDDQPSGGPPASDLTGNNLTLAAAKWSVAGIRIEPVRRGDLQQSVWITGKVALNEDRLAQIDPLVEGMVHEVKVQYGDEVHAGQLLAVVDSREVGQAKLELFKSRLTSRMAKVDCQWLEQIEENTQALIRAIENQTPIIDIERLFRDKAMGEYRQQLVSSYAQYHKSQADYERLKELSDRGITAGKEFLSAKAARDADQATFQSWLEQIKFTSTQKKLVGQHELSKAETAEEASRTFLEIIGVPDDEIDEIDPTSQGEAISHYPITAPFDGTVIQKDVVLKERVGPNSHLFTVADLSQVWVKADMYEQHLSLLNRLAGKAVAFRTSAYPGRRFEARVFYTGDLVDEASRTIPLMAVAENPDRDLKPGMFVEVELPIESVADVVWVPDSAIQEHAGKTFVFVHREGDLFERRDVRIGRLLGESREILEGLEAKTPIVVGGAFALKSEMLREQLVDED